MTKLQITIGLLLLTLVALGRVVGNDFIDLDDEIYITKNPHVLGGLTGDNIAWAWGASFHAGLWLPLTWHSLQLDAHLFGGEARGFHLTNLVLHAANVALLFWLLTSMTGKVGNSALVAALFAVHPLHVESVAWAAERKDVLSTFFWILTIAAYVHYVRRPGMGRYSLVVAALALGLLAKPMLVTLPCVLLLLDYWPLRRWQSPRADADGLDGAAAAGDIAQPATAGWLVVEKLPLLLLSLAASAVTVIAQRHGGALIPSDQLSLSVRLSHAVESYGWYLEKTFLPWDLGVMYPYDFTSWSPVPFAVGALLLLGLTGVAAWFARRHGAWLLGWLWFVGVLVPVIGLVQAGEQAFADRFVYVPHIGLFLFLVWAADTLSLRWRWRPEARGLLAAATIAVLAVLSWNQAGHWSDTVAIWEHTLSVTDNNYRAHANLANALGPRGDLDQARAHLERSVSIKPDVPETQYLLGSVLLKLGQWQDAADHLVRAVKLRPSYGEAHDNLGLTYLHLGQSARALKHSRRAVELQPDEPGAHLNLGLAYVVAEKADLATSAFCRALELKPDYAEAHNQLSRARLHQGRLDEAAAHSQKALDVKGNYADAHFHLGVARSRQARWSEAAQQFRAAVDLQPRLVHYRRYLAYSLYQSGLTGAAAAEYAASSRLDPAWPKATAAEALRLATHAQKEVRDVDQSLELARQTCQATEFQRPELLDTLAVCLAEDGQFADAVKTARDALSRAAGQDELARQIREHLELFEMQRPAPRSGTATDRGTP
jgi:tetratricopeptide (TPR) repeat protein